MKYLEQIVYIDRCLGKLIELDISDDEKDDILDSEDYINKLLFCLGKLSSKDIVLAIYNCENIFDFVDITRFVKKYPIDKAFLKENRDEVINEYNKLENFMSYVNKISHDNNEFKVFVDKFKVLEVEENLLKLMPNSDLYELSKKSGNWEEKLFIYSHFKKKESK